MLNMSIRLSNTQEALLRLLKRHGAQSHYGLYHIARANGFKFSPSSVRSRVSEMVKIGLVTSTKDMETTPSGRKAKIWKAIKF